jgi:hypothetical protein
MEDTLRAALSTARAEYGDVGACVPGSHVTRSESLDEARPTK